MAKMIRVHTGSFLTKEQAEQFRDTFKNLTVVVRCKDCRHGCKPSTFQYYPNLTWCNRHSTSHDDDWFCADGVAKDINVPDKEGR